MVTRAGLLRRVRGIEQVIQLLLILVAVIAIVTGVGYAMMHQVVKQAESAKPDISVTAAQAYLLGSNGIGVTVWVENTGTTPVTIQNIQGMTTANCQLSSDNFQPVTIEPGQSLPISTVLVFPAWCSPSSGEGVYIYVVTSGQGSSAQNYVGIATIIQGG